MVLEQSSSSEDPSWWTIIDRFEEIGIVFCSVDAPNLPRTI